MILLPRRRFLKVLTGIIAAPAVVKADSLMRIVVPEPSWFHISYDITEMLYQANEIIFDDLLTHELAFDARISFPAKAWRRFNA